MATLHLIGGEKGGVGKSVIARLLAQYMIDRDIPFTAFDSDRSHGALLRFYSDYAQPVSVDEFDSLDTIFETAAEHDEQRILVDLAAQTALPLNRWIGESGVLELAAELNIDVNYWNVMDSGKDCVDLLGSLMEEYGGSLNYVLVLNHLRGDKFDIFDQSPARNEAEQKNAAIIKIKRLHPQTMIRIDAHSSSFWAAVNADSGPNKLSLLDRQRVKTWLRNSYEQFDLIGI